MAAGEPETRFRPVSDYGVVVIGAGQTGLTLGYYLARQGYRYVILERGDSVASATRE